MLPKYTVYVRVGLPFYYASFSMITGILTKIRSICIMWREKNFVESGSEISNHVKDNLGFLVGVASHFSVTNCFAV